LEPADETTYPGPSNLEPERRPIPRAFNDAEGHHRLKKPGFASVPFPKGLGSAPLAAVEGFVRQILGWRDYVRGVYWHEPKKSSYILPRVIQAAEIAAQGGPDEQSDPSPAG
jgi:hypothetical protein